MKCARYLAVAAVAGWAMLPAPARAAAYGVYEQGAAVLGMGGAGTASVHDPSALFFNPAAMTRLEGTQVQGGGSLLMPFTSFAGISPYPGYGVTEEMEAQKFPLPTFYLTHRYGEKSAIGIGVNSPFGLGVDWKDPDKFSGRYIVTRADLRSVNASVSAAYLVNPRLSVAFGGNLSWAKVALHNRTFSPAPGGGGGQYEIAKVDLESDYTPGYGWNAALSMAPNKSWTLGATYRSKVLVDAHGNADFTQLKTGNATVDAAVAAQLPPDQAVNTVLRFPATWSGGVAWHWGANWTIEGDVNYTEWSLFEDLPIYFEKSPAANKRIVENYDNTWRGTFGVEHRLPAFSYRFGYYYEQAAAPIESVSPILPDTGRNGGTLGLGFGFGKDKRLTVDLYELALFAQHRWTENVNRDNFNGHYRSYINSSGLTVAYRW